MNPNPINVGIVEDDPVTARYIHSFLKRNRQVDQVHTWESAESFLSASEAQTIQVLFIDLHLPGMSGLELLTHLAERPELACIVLTTSDDPNNVFAAVKAGACGYILKSSSPTEIERSLSAATKDGLSLSPEIARLLWQEMQQSIPAQTRGVEVLSDREIEILELMAKGTHTKDVAMELGLSYETVRCHIKNTYRKLHVRSRHEAVTMYASQNMRSKG